MAGGADLVRRAVDALNRDDFDGCLSEWADDAALDWTRSHGLDARLYRGKDEIRGFLVALRSAFVEVRTELLGEPVELGDGVLVFENIAHVRGREGIEAQARSAWLVTIRDGRQTSLTLYQTKGEALEAAAELAGEQPKAVT